MRGGHRGHGLCRGLACVIWCDRPTGRLWAPTAFKYPATESSHDLRTHARIMHRDPGRPACPRPYSPQRQSPESLLFTGPALLGPCVLSQETVQQGAERGCGRDRGPHCPQVSSWGWLSVPVVCAGMCPASSPLHTPPSPILAPQKTLSSWLLAFL